MAQASDRFLEPRLNGSDGILYHTLRELRIIYEIRARSTRISLAPWPRRIAPHSSSAILP